jgi:hypothetical protein
MATSRFAKDKSCLALKQSSKLPINHRIKSNLKSVDISYGGLSDSADNPTIYVNPLRATPTTLKDDNTRPARREHNLPLQPIIDWDETAREAGSILLKTYDLGILDRYPSVKEHALLMYDRLSFHKENFPGYCPDPIWMVGKSLLEGPAFTEKWAADLKLARFRMMNMKFNIEPDSEPPFKLDNYSGTYIPFHFIFWREEVNDYEAMFGLPYSDPELLEELEDFVAEISERLISEEELCSEPPDTFVYRPVATSGFTGDETKPEWEIEFDDPSQDLEEQVMVCARSIAPKRPSETRDIGIMRPASLRFHRRFMYHLQQACFKIKGCPYGKSPEYLRSVVSSIGSNNDYFYMRDYTKSGMTIPHLVQRAVLRGFFRRRPGYGDEAADFFSRQQFFVKQPSGEYELLRPDTGSPLGMFVEGYTLFQYALHNMNISQISSDRRLFQFSATNDDMVVGSRDLPALQEYLLADERNNSALGMSYKDTKSGISEDAFVYCEEYWMGDHLDPKSCLFADTMIGAKYAHSVFHAKEYAYAIMLSAREITPPVRNALREVQSHWGYEFHEDEFDWPFLFGGWLPQIVNGLDYSIQWFNGDLKAVGGYWANQVHLRKKGKLDELPHLSLGRRLGIKLLEEPSNPSYFLDLVPFLGSKRALQYHYRTGASHPRAILKEYLLLSKLRKERYDKIIEGSVDCDPVYKDYLYRHPSSYIPPDMPYIRVREAYTRVVLPRLGFREQGAIFQLHRMRKLGYIDFTVPCKTSETSVKLAEIGISSNFDYPYLPITPEGVSTEVLRTHLAGLLTYYEETGNMIVSLGDNDAPLKESALWGCMPTSSLLTVCRFWPYILKYDKRSPDMSDLIRWGEVFKGIAAQNAREEDFDEPEPEDNPVYTEAQLLIGQMLRDVIRDFDPDPDATIASLMHRIEARKDNLFAEETAMRLADFTSGDVSLLPTARSGNEQAEEGAGGSDSSDIFDPWAELGV